MNEVELLKKKFFTHLEERGLAYLFRGQEGLIRPSIHLEAVPVEDESSLTLGQSKFGGRPDMPPDMTWPLLHDRSLGFVAQMNMAEIKPFDGEQALPDMGILYFFCDWDMPHFGWKVLYYNGDSSLVKCRPFPDDIPVKEPNEHPARFPQCSVRFTHELTIPWFESMDWDKLNWEERDDIDAIGEYFNLYDFLRGPDYFRPSHRLLGQPEKGYGDMQMQCQLLANSLSRYDSQSHPILTLGRSDWRLLFELDSDDKSRMAWSDWGTAFFWIKYLDLQQRNFDAVQVTFGCG